MSFIIDGGEIVNEIELYDNILQDLRIELIGKFAIVGISHSTLGVLGDYVKWFLERRKTDLCLYTIEIVGFAQAELTFKNDSDDQFLLKM